MPVKHIEKSLYRTLFSYTFALFVIPAKAGMTSGDYKIIYISIGYPKVQKYSF